MTVPLRQPAPADRGRAARDAPAPRPTLVAPGPRIATPHGPRPSFAWPAVLTLLVLASAVVAAPPLRVVGGAPVAAGLHRPPLYVALAPLCDVLDALTLLSLRQHVALLVTAALGHLAWRVRRAARVPAGRRRGRVRRELAAAATVLGALAGVYAAGMVVPRPMAALRLRDGDALAVDVHSHTRASHDGRPGFTVERNRAWHRDAGFDVAYVSDHGTLAAAAAARAGNPARAGGGTVLLPAVEVWCAGQHVVVLGAAPRDTAPECGPWLAAAAAHGPADAWRDDRPVVVLTITKRLWTLPRLPAARAVELSDGAPRAFDQVRQNAARLRRVVDGAELATVAGSNNHGWGATAAAWSVLMIPGWRSLPPDALDAAIRRRLWRGGRRAVSVVERRRVEPGATPLALAATVPAVGWGVLVTLSGAERAAWLAWAWGAWALVRVARRTRVRARPARRSPVLAGARRPAA